VLNSGRGGIHFLLGLGIGVGLGLLFAPQSGEETREWLAETGKTRIKRLRRKGRRLVFEAQDLLDKSQEGVSRVLKTGRHALGSIAARLD
jgi:gas vesicle protein